MDSERESKRKLSVLEEYLGSSDPEELQMEAPAEREVSEEEEPQDPEIHKLDQEIGMLERKLGIKNDDKRR